MGRKESEPIQARCTVDKSADRLVKGPMAVTTFFRLPTSDFSLSDYLIGQVQIVVIT